MSARVGRALLAAGSILTGSGAVRAATGPAILNVPLSVRQMGMGDVSLGGADVLRAWSNPALLARQDTSGEVAVAGADLYDGQQATFSAGGAGRLEPGWAAGVLAFSFHDVLNEIDAFGDSTGASFSRGVVVLGAVTAMRIEPWLSTGVTLKHVSNRAGPGAASGIATDLGLHAAWHSFELGTAARNLGRSADRSAPDGEPRAVYPMEIRAGVAWVPATGRATIGAEFIRSRERRPHVGVGMEWRLTRRFLVRGGVSHLGAGFLRPTAGFSGERRGLGFDYAFATHPLGASHHVNLSWRFGAPADERTPAGTGTAEPVAGPPAP